jgi:hypothetical protein
MGVFVACGEAPAMTEHAINKNEDASMSAAMITHQNLPEAVPDGLTAWPPTKVFHYYGRY